MRWITLLLAACCWCLSSAYASDEAAENVCDALQTGPSPAGKTIAIEQLPRGFLCRDGSAPSCRSTVTLPRLEAHPFLYAPIEMAPELRVSNPCR